MVTANELRDLPVPPLTLSEIAAEADAVLAMYAKLYGEPMCSPIDVDELAVNVVGMTVMFAELRELLGPDVDGAIYFSPKAAPPTTTVMKGTNPRPPVPATPSAHAPTGGPRIGPGRTNPKIPLCWKPTHRSTPGRAFRPTTPTTSRPAIPPPTTSHPATPANTTPTCRPIPLCIPSSQTKNHPMTANRTKITYDNH